MKEDRRLRNLRYQMRKKGYQFDTKHLVAIMPSHDKRSNAHLMKRISISLFKPMIGSLILLMIVSIYFLDAIISDKALA